MMEWKASTEALAAVSRGVQKLTEKIPGMEGLPPEEEEAVQGARPPAVDP